MNYEDLDPGIREVVRMLRDAGFNTTDSGDGVTKVALGHEGVMTVPHVHCFFDKRCLTIEEMCYQLRKVCYQNGLAPQPGNIQVTYDPMAPEYTSISLTHFNDSDLATGRARIAEIHRRNAEGDMSPPDLEADAEPPPL
jgi:hypothetical protein